MIGLMVMRLEKQLFVYLLYRKEILIGYSLHKNQHYGVNHNNVIAIDESRNTTA